MGVIMRLQPFAVPNCYDYLRVAAKVMTEPLEFSSGSIPDSVTAISGLAEMQRQAL